MTCHVLDSVDCLIPDWPAPPNVRALCTTRSGGVSQGPYASLNLGDHVGDDPAHVAQNRHRLRQTLGVRPVFLQQIHGTAVHTLAPDMPDGTQADGATTTTPDLACTIMVADCLPVLLCDASGTRVAAVHAGWRGLAGLRGHGVLESAFQSFLPQAPVECAQAAPELIAWLGPCIGPSAFEVGDEVRSAFVACDPQAAVCFTPGLPGKWWADLAGLARRRLGRLGVTRVHGNDGSLAWCTVNDGSRFFSHRRDRVTGRMAAAIWRADADRCQAFDGASNLQKK